ncbi:MAG TPA: hypothetical protein VEL03_18520 [Streptosporangiaceae bacterium]|nr:hypothetical protein [Streptosporangiaceae bacterium]
MTRNGRIRLAAIVAVSAAAAVGTGLSALPQAWAGSQGVAYRSAANRTAGLVAADRAAAGPAAGLAEPASPGAGSWRLLRKWRVAHGGILSVLVALPHGDAWAFGEYGEVAPYSGHPLAEYWNGSAWSLSALPASVRCGPIAAAGASSAANVWAVGVDGCVLRLAGTKWTVAKNFTSGGQFTGIAVLGPSDVWVFGATAAPAGRPGLGTWHYNGSFWRQTHGIGGEVQSASAASATDIWAIGIADHDNQLRSFLEHYTSGRWQRVATGSLIPYSVLASGSRVWMQGSVGQSPASVLERLHSGHWQPVAAPDAGASYGQQPPISDGRGGLWLIGTSGNLLVPDLALHLSGTGRWTVSTFSAGTELLDLARVPASTSVLGLAFIKGHMALYGYGRG